MEMVGKDTPNWKNSDNKDTGVTECGVTLGYVHQIDLETCVCVKGKWQEILLKSRLGFY